MDATKKTRIPQLCAHKATGQSFIRIDGRAIYFGRTGLPETAQKYHQFIAEWLASGCQTHSEPEQITVNELCARFWVYAEGYYVRADGTPTSELDCYRSAMKPLLELYGLNKAVEFGPKALSGFMSGRFCVRGPRLRLVIVRAGQIGPNNARR